MFYGDNRGRRAVSSVKKSIVSEEGGEFRDGETVEERDRRIAERQRWEREQGWNEVD